MLFTGSFILCVLAYRVPTIGDDENEGNDDDSRGHDDDDGSSGLVVMRTKHFLA